MGKLARTISIIFGIIALLVGGLWIGQGLNMIPGSVMTGNRMWFYIGVVVAILGLLVVIAGLRRPVRNR